MKNKSKWASYKLAFDHINAAIAQGFYIEALALEESIMADRLESALRGKGLKTDGKLQSLGRVLGEVERNSKEFQGLHEWLAKNGLQFEVLRKWTWERNKFIHNVAHGFPGQPVPVSAEEYDARGKAAAVRGKKLARIICDWSRNEIGAVKSAKKA